MFEKMGICKYVLLGQWMHGPFLFSNCHVHSFTSVASHTQFLHASICPIHPHATYIHSPYVNCPICPLPHMPTASYAHCPISLVPHTLIAPYHHYPKRPLPHMSLLQMSIGLSLLSFMFFALYAHCSKRLLLHASIGGLILANDQENCFVIAVQFRKQAAFLLPNVSL